MNIVGSRVLVLGGYGMVGTAVCHDLLDAEAAHLIVHSLNQSESEAAVASLVARHPEASLEPVWGNIFVRHAHKDLPRSELLSDTETRRRFLDDVIGDLDPETLKEHALFRLMQETRPDIVVDCVNTATALAYQDLFTGSREVMQALDAGEEGPIQEATIRLVATLDTPQLIRHVQILYASLKEAGTGMYLKIGTTGTGGMGLNIPYTHSEERPSRVLLSKAAMAGAHSLLLFLMGRTPDGPITKEVKPAAAIAWKSIGSGPVLRAGHSIPLYDVPPESAEAPAGTLPLRLPEDAFDRLGGDRVLESVWIDTGENGLFAAAEFEVISSIGQMEYVTPEEISAAVIQEIRGGNTGFDIVSALDMSVMGPSYRAGVSRGTAIAELRRLQESEGVRSVAFEVLGPPRLSKLLYEAELLRRTAGGLKGVADADPVVLGGRCVALVEEDADLRAAILSIGIPVLLPDGRLLRGPQIKIPPMRGLTEEPVSPERVDHWARAGWVDLRADNLARWKQRAGRILAEAAARPADDTSSRHPHERSASNPDAELDISAAVAWILRREDEGERMK